MNHHLTSLILLSLLFSAPAYANEPGLATQDVENGLYETVAPAEPVGLVADRYFSPTTGSELMITLLRGYQWLDDKFPSTLGDTSSSARLGRAGKFVIEDLLFLVGTITQHEIFGHGFRAREFHMPVHYHIGLTNGSTNFKASDYLKLSLHERTALSSGGMEATSRLARQFEYRWLESNWMDPREAHFYLLNTLDQTFYVLDTRKSDKSGTLDGHDVQHYVQEINAWHGKKALSVSSLRHKVLIDFLNPYFFYSLYSIGSYLVDGSGIYEFPMLSLGEYRYLPALRLVLAPFGPEYQMTNYIRGPEHDVIATLRFGNTENSRSAAMDMHLSRLFVTDLLTFDGKASLWRQPKLFTTNVQANKRRFGGALSVLARYRMAERIEMLGELGYKTSGYLPGEILKHTPILRIGFKAFL